MSLNYKEIDAILDELDINEAFIQKIRQPDYSKIIFDLYKPGNACSLMLSFNQGGVRLHKITRKYKNMKKPPRFTEFLRSRIKGCKIKDIRQLGEERIVKIVVASLEGQTNLWVRLWGGGGNIIVCDTEGTILETLYRRPKRNEVTGETYNPEEEISKLENRDGKKKEYSLREFPEDMNLPENSGFNAKIEELYYQKEQEGSLEHLRNRVIKTFTQRENTITARIRKMEKQLSDYENFEQYKQWGDLILSNLHQIKKGDTWAEVDNYFAGNERVQIQLDPKASPNENAEKFYKKFHKAKSGLELLQDEVENKKRSLLQLEIEKEKILAETDPEVLKSLIEERKTVDKTLDKKIPGLQFTSGNFIILVGRKDKENDELLRRHVRGNDWWLHTRDYPGGYVFVKSEKGKTVPLEVLLDAGNLALWFSKGKNAGKGELYYTQVKYLRRAKHGRLGLVIPTQEKNLSIKLDNKRLKRLLEGE